MPKQRAALIFVDFSWTKVLFKCGESEEDGQERKHKLEINMLPALFVGELCPDRSHGRVGIIYYSHLYSIYAMLKIIMDVVQNVVRIKCSLILTKLWMYLLTPYQTAFNQYRLSPFFLKEEMESFFRFITELAHNGHDYKMQPLTKECSKLAHPLCCRIAHSLHSWMYS